MRLLATKIEDFQAACVALRTAACQYYQAEWDEARDFGILEVVYSKDSDALSTLTPQNWSLVCRGLAPIHFFSGMPPDIRVLTEATLLPNTNTRHITVAELITMAAQ